MVLGLDAVTGREVPGVCQVQLTKKARDVITRCCSRNVNPNERRTADGMLQTLRLSTLLE
jgi:hypothetical protein